MKNCDIALKAFIDFKKIFDELKKTDLSESDTRSKILDKIFIEILNWQENDITREGHVKEVGYYDYLIHLPNFQFVVEAKKSFEDFKLPITARHSKLVTLQKGNKEVIQQIREYLIGKNLMFGIITNGHQFLIGKFVNTDGTDWAENELLIFNSLDDIEKRFIEFYNTISREALLENGIFPTSISPIFAKTILESLHVREQRLNRNIFSAPLQPLIQRFFSELIYDDENIDFDFLEQCYVKNEDIDKYRNELNIIINDEAPSFDERIIKVRNTNNTIKQLKENINAGIGDLPDPILIIGGKGVGKTTFLTYFLKSILDTEKNKNRLVIYLDLKNYTEQQISDTKKLYKEIIEKINNRYPELNLTKLNILEKVYQKEIKERIDGTWSFIGEEKLLSAKKAEFIESKIEDYISHLNKICEYLIRICRKRLCIIFDNGDQLKDKCQRDIYLLAQSLHNTTKTIVIIALREGYFYKLKNNPPFDAFRTTVFHISAPPYSEVIRRRIKYLIDNYEFTDIKDPESVVSYRSKTLKLLFNNFYYTLFENNNLEIIKYLEQTSYPNIRLGLDKLIEFMISANTAIHQYVISEKYNIPIWEFTKSVALGSRLYYHHRESKIYNLFYPSSRNNNHFTKLRLLLFLKYNLNYEQKYIVVENILDIFYKAGYPFKIILSELEELFKYRMIEEENYSSDIDSSNQIDNRMNIRLTNSGYYYLEFIGNFDYMELVLQDSPIYDEKYYTRLLGCFPYADDDGKRDLRKRHQSVKIFIEYLTQQELNEKKNLLTIGAGKVFNINIMQDLLSYSLNEGLNRVDRAIKKHEYYH